MLAKEKERDIDRSFNYFPHGKRKITKNGKGTYINDVTLKEGRGKAFCDIFKIFMKSFINGTKTYSKYY